MNNFNIVVLNAQEKFSSKQFDIINDLIKTMQSFDIDTDILVSSIFYIANYENITLPTKPSSRAIFIINKLLSVSTINFNLKNKRLHSNNQKLFLLKSENIEVVMAALIIQIYIMRTLDDKSQELKDKHSLESKFIYAPIAGNLGIYTIKTELEDLSLKFSNPKAYNNITTSIASQKSEREEYLNSIINEINILIDKDQINYAIHGRLKHVRSIYNKTVLKDKTVKGLHDLIALRFLVDTVEDCYTILGLVNTVFDPDSTKFKDYITNPKKNGYQSLHTVVNYEDQIYEIQIRTKEMHDFAEKGVAAHWAYKKGKNTTKRELANSSGFFEELKELIIHKDKKLKDTSILSKYVYVFTPDMDVYELEKGSTPIDFAFRVHTKVGIGLASAVVNNSIVPLSYELKNEDIISVNTSTSTSPKDSWINIAKTKNAKSKIKRYLNESNKSQLVLLGKKYFENELKNYEEPGMITDALIEKSLRKKNIKTKEVLYYELGKKTITPVVALNNIFPQQKKIDVNRLLSIKNNNSKDSNKGIVVDGLGKTRIHISKCCNPIPGDEIIGYITLGRGIAVHSHNCKNNKALNSNRLIDVYWGNELAEVFETGIRIIAENHEKALQSIITLISNNNIILSNISTKHAGFNQKLVIQLYLKVNNLENLNDIINKINSVVYVIDVKRTRR